MLIGKAAAEPSALAEKFSAGARDIGKPLRKLSAQAGSGLATVALSRSSDVAVTRSAARRFWTIICV